MSFSSQLSRVRPAYEIPSQDLVGEVLVPCYAHVRGGQDLNAGFFSSRCLAQIAPGLATFVNDTNGILPAHGLPGDQ